ncbi:DUF5606 domain-containing protein [Cytophagales bacterium LB-30]|uniref:DUF5606 domain-containing protein n=1 Tax=Shiella aurantiaca TaxID=3058365 RepID=A0ABT8F9K4_9BACT|nr:DUF5606 domain-containing protein [Shiella aurantiaca]MDN4166934.1 DUF5606 domain-containing protein [Shiella aurantiaca]
MELKEIAAVSGKGGLFKIVKPTRTGVILESLDEARTKLVASASQRVSVLSEISIYTTTQEGAEPLEAVLQKIFAEFGNDTGVSGSSDGDELRSFLRHVLPEFDEDRVYVSDIKKLVNWYGILVKYAPEVMKPNVEETKEAKKAPKKEAKAEIEASEVEAKPKAKKTTKKKSE